MSFFQRVTEEKGIYNEILKVEWAENIHFIKVSDIVGLIENYPETEQQEITNTISKIDFHNGDLLHYFTFLALCFIKTL